MTAARAPLPETDPALEICPACSDDAVGEPFLEIGPVPVNCSAFASSATEARRAERGFISLTACSRCGYIHNARFDPAAIAYGSGYDNSLDHSEVFRAYEKELVSELDRRWPLRGGTVVEIGCGSGHFLASLCRRAGCDGIGFDPSFPGGTVEAPISIVASMFTGSEEIQAKDLICCRHVLEHIADPYGFLSTIQVSMDPGCGLYVEVPSAEHIFGSSDVWDLIYPHYSYFSAPSLIRLAQRAGIEVLAVNRRFNEEFLSIHATKGRSPGAAEHGRARVEDLISDTERFAHRFARRVSESARTIEVASADGKSIALWGAGARAVTFLNLVPGADRIPLIVDVNPAKTGRHVPGTGQRVVGPDDHQVRDADVVMVMNAVYAGEIGERLRLVGSSAELVVV